MPRMEISMRRLMVLVFTIVSLVMPFPVLLNAFAQGEKLPAAQLARIGYLSCQVASGWGFVFGSSRKLRCTYSASNKHGDAEHYTGSLSRVGTDIGYSQSAVMLWTVHAPGLDITNTPGLLSGSYQGQTASAAIGAPVGGRNVLRQTRGKSIELWPVSIEGNNGLNLAAGVTTIVLKFTTSSSSE